MYHRFGEDDTPSTNTTMEQFAAHIEELKSGKYTVLPLPEIVSALREGRPLPDRTIGLSIDDAYLSVFTRAWPILRENNLPFTLFIATDAIDRKYSRFMSWDQIRELAKSGVTIGSQTASHPHMARMSAAENAAELAKSNQRFVEELGAAPTLFAYPYGEASLAAIEAVKAAGFVAAFGQHSGVIDRTGAPFFMPRFALNENYGDMTRFRMAANALSIPVTDITPADMKTGDNNPPALGFTLVGEKTLPNLACYASHEGKVRMERLGEHRVEIRLTTPLPKGRTRINCTAPGPDGRWFWFGRQFVTH
ncbi:MAG: polysaccharide deacetylase family protein [Rhodospirillales bacterium]|nr:polysaccharide deacetylase family protein [Rhodospirillales bacterium]